MPKWIRTGMRHACVLHLLTCMSNTQKWRIAQKQWKIPFLAAPFALNIWNTARILLPFNEPDSWQVFWYVEHFSHFLAFLHEMDHFSDFFICFGSSKRLYFVISTNTPFVLDCNFNSHPNTTWNCIWPIFVSLWTWTLFRNAFGFFVLLISFRRFDGFNGIWAGKFFKLFYFQNGRHLKRCYWHLFAEDIYCILKLEMGSKITITLTIVL